MPGRKVPLVTGHYYHVFNRGVARMPTFTTIKSFRRAMELIAYYQNASQPLRYSIFRQLSVERREQILMQMRKKNDFLVDILSFCFMPNHFHFLLMQKVDGGISKFMSNFTNSFTRYFNTKQNRIGPLFQGKFKAVLIESIEQLIHLSRYIHLNPFTSRIVTSIEELLDYEFSSLPEYLESRNLEFVEKGLIMTEFKTPDKYKEFILNHADYQKKLEEIKHLTIDQGSQFNLPKV